MSEKNKYSLVLAVTPGLNGVWEWKNQETALQLDLVNFHFFRQQKVSNPDFHHTVSKSFKDILC